MTKFDKIRKAAVKRLGGEKALKDRLPKVKSARALKAVSDDRYFSTMSFRVFSAGLKQSMVRDKWPAFEEVWFAFDPYRVRAIDDEQLEALMNETRIIRHWGKIKATRANGAVICDIAEEFGGVGAYLAAWPADDIAGLWSDLQKRFSQLGGMSGPYFLRWVGKDTHTMSPWVIKALAHWKLYDGTGKGKKETRRVADIVYALSQEASRPMAEVSMTLAASVD